MIRIEPAPWDEMVGHARAIYPNECVGVMLGSSASGAKVVSEALRMENVHDGPQAERYTLDQKALLAADAQARERKLELIGIYHSHPDCDAYFSETDLKNSCPWYSFVVLSIKQGAFDHANSWLPDPDQTRADKEELEYGDSNG
jgi:proteasome lid subunit RPN8/RPN11